MGDENSQVMDRVRRALGRSAPLSSAPVPPEMDESITRRASSGDDLGKLFVEMCEANKMHVSEVGESELAAGVAVFLLRNKVRRIALSDGLAALAEKLVAAGFEAKCWNEITLDQVYDVDCGITDVHYVVAETGSLVVRASAGQGRSLSLVPAIHVAVVKKTQILADLIDLFERLTKEGCASAVSLITGPSKTSDIEMNLVVGVHGPTMVQVFYLAGA